MRVVVFPHEVQIVLDPLELHDLQTLFDCKIGDLVDLVGQSPRSWLDRSTQTSDFGRLVDNIRDIDGPNAQAYFAQRDDSDSDTEYYNEDAGDQDDGS